MSKLAAIIVSSRRIKRGAVSAALLWLALLVPAGSPAAAADPALRPSEQLDIRRLGKVSDDERSVLRVEWRAAVTGAEEARAVEDMLDSLRRMQGTMGEISRLIRTIPAQTPAVEPAAVEPPESGLSDKTLALAGSAVVGLLAIWLTRRREPAPDAAATAAPVAGVEAVPAAAALAVPSVPPLATDAPPDAPPVEFSLEEADPEAIARANARLQKLQDKRSARASGSSQESNVEPALQLAEIMLSLGLEEGAAQTLVEYTETHPRQALHHWLKLLDIYHDSGHQEDFREAAEKLRRNFNIQAADWAKTSEEDAPTLENYSRLSEHVQQTWMQPEVCVAYLRNLLEDNREGARAGFPRPVAEEILLLIDVLKETSGAGQTAGV
jgi:hypothetical protein